MDGAQVLLELAGARALDRPVAGVVRPHGQLVDQDAVGGLEQLDGHHADDADPVGDADGELVHPAGGVVVEAGRRGEHLGVDAVALHGLDHRPDGDLPERGAGDQHRQLAHQRHPLLGEQRAAVPLEQVGHLVGAGDDEHAPAVVAPARRLEDDRPPHLLGELRRRVHRAHLGPRRLRLPGGGERPAQHQLVLGVDQRVGAGGDAHAVGGQRPQVLGRHVLVVEGDHGGAVGEGAQRVEVAVVADPDVGGDQGGGLAGVGGEHPQRLPERDGGLVGHPGQLAGPHHGDDGQAGAWVDYGGHGDW